MPYDVLALLFSGEFGQLGLVTSLLFEDRTSHMVLEVIKSHVKNRGVGYSSKASLRCDIPALKFSREKWPEILEFQRLVLLGLRALVFSQVGA